MDQNYNSSLGIAIQIFVLILTPFNSLWIGFLRI